MPEQQTLTMPPAPWGGLGENDQYGWFAALSSAIGLAAATGQVTQLRNPDGEIVAEIGPPSGTASAAMPWLPAHGPSWEVAFGPVDTVIEAHSAEQAATLSAAERDFEDEMDRYAEPDPNPRVWVRQLKAGGTCGPWQQVYLDPAAIETAVARLRADEEES